MPANRRHAVPEPLFGFALVVVPISATATAFDRIDTSNRLLLLMLGIRRYRLSHHTLPPSLDAVGIDPRLLEDPYSGRQLVYRPAGSDYLLYSVGPNDRDDGGVAADENGERPAGDLGVIPVHLTEPGRVPRTVQRQPHILLPKLTPGTKLVD